MPDVEFKHISVMPDEVIEGLDIKPGGIYVDGTMGGAGHGQLICEKLLKFRTEAGTQTEINDTSACERAKSEAAEPVKSSGTGDYNGTGRYIGIDRDADAIKASSERLKRFGDMATAVRSNYSGMAKVLDDLGIDGVDGILLDLGVSSFQLDTAERGFSYMHDAPLDMRMDDRQSNTARTIVNTYSFEELARIIKEYGEEEYAKNIAKRIVAEREKKPIETTFELVEIIKASMPMKAKIGQGHPAKKTFQAIRIELNSELTELRECLDSMIKRLKPGGRFVIITFHSLEDRIVKNAFKTFENPCTCPPQFPVCVCGKKPLGTVITKKPILPGAEELKNNSRSKSAKLRIFEAGGREGKAK